MRPSVATLEIEDTMPVLMEGKSTIGDQKWVMWALADLYSDITTAVVREYSTNAWDAMVMAGETGPIEVTLPATGIFGQNEFRVRDRGTGMTIEQLTETFPNFGLSNKRETDKANGMLGFGSKVGVAYTNAFTINSVCNGLRNFAQLTRNADNEIIWQVFVLNQPTDEPNGTEIVVPIHNIDEFNHKAREFYKFCKPGMVLVNGVEPKHEVGERITDNFYLAKEYGASYVVMAGVPYKINNPAALFADTKMNYVNFVAYIDAQFDKVDFAKSREALAYTEKTKKTLHKVITDFADTIIEDAKKDISKATSHFDAFERWDRWGDLLGRGFFGELSYKGDVLKDTFPIAAQRYSVGQSRYNTWGVSNWNISQMHNTVIVTGFPSSTVSSSQKKKMRDWGRFKDIKMDYVLFTTADSFSNVWVNPDRVVTWDKVKEETPKVSRPKNPSAPSGRPKGSWDIYTVSGYQEGVHIPSTGTLYYVTVQEAKYRSPWDTLRLINEPATTTVIRVPANRMAKFKRDFPKITPFENYLKTKVIKDGNAIVSDNWRYAKGVGDDMEYFLRYIPANQLHDPRFAEAKRRLDLGKGDDSWQRYEANLSLARSLGLWYDVVKYTADTKFYFDSNRVLGDYPIISRWNRYNYSTIPVRDIVLYMNALYDAHLKGKK